MRRFGGGVGGATLLCALLYVYVFPYQPDIHNPNENVRFYMTAALVEQGSYRIDALRQRWGWVNDSAVRKGHYYSVKAPGVSVLGVPFYAAYRAWVQRRGRPVLQSEALWCCRMGAVVLPTLLWLGLFGAWLARASERRWSGVVWVYALGLGSPLCAYALLFVSHTLSAVAAGLAFQLCVQLRQAPSPELGSLPSRWRGWGKSAAAGLMTAAVTWFEYPGLLCSLGLSAYGWWACRRPGQRIAFGLGTLPPVFSMMHFQWRCFGSPWRPGHRFLENDDYRDLAEEGFYGASTVDWEALVALWLDPGFGLWPLTPLLLLAPWGLYRHWRAGQRLEVGVAVAVTVSTALAIAAMNNWRGGWTVGPRYLALLYPWLAWLSQAALVAPWRPTWLRSAVVLACLATGMVLSGWPSFVYPHVPPEIERPLPDLLWPLWRWQFVPQTQWPWPEMAPGWALLPLACGALLAWLHVVWVLPWRAAASSGALGWRTRAWPRLAGTATAVLLTALLQWPAWRPGAPDVRRVRRIALITRRWHPSGRDKAARLEGVWCRGQHASAWVQPRLAALYLAQGRQMEHARVLAGQPACASAPQPPKER
ncbi:MAG: hypothetical protein ACPGUV_01185 [Polyangiales bacterium]